MGLIGKIFGSSGESYYCKYCGSSFPSVGLLTGRGCHKNPHGSNHELYEGSKKSEYVCKYCGYKFSSIMDLTGRPCHKNPNHRPHHPAYHEPAL